MNVILVPKIGGRGNTVRLNGKMLLLLVLLLVASVVGIAIGTYLLGQRGNNVDPNELVREWSSEMDEQRAEIVDAKRYASDNLDALAMRLGQMQSHIMRLDALGKRLTEMAKLDKSEFDFNAKPAQGGPAMPGKRSTFDVPNFVASLNTVSDKLADRAQKLDLLETLMMNRNLEREVVPTGRPIKKGWLSSYFGMRADPFTGKQERHKGLDFAGKQGGDVVAVASGVITWAGNRYGYGRLVEINHGSGYSTRYGHSQKLLVKIGQKVKKGDVIAEIGSSGRSTGPHVHFEVHKNGKVVDPLKYIRAR
ncbi:MAG: M23 family metallopeptidase [Thiohalomonadales bacterium]